MKTLLKNKALSKNGWFLLSLIFTFEGLSFLVCFLVALAYSEPTNTFLVPGLLAVGCGAALFFSSSKTVVPTADNRISFLLITLAWVTVILLGTVPYLLGNIVPSVADGLYESVSGFTLCGSSVIANIDNIPRSVVLWRSLTHWLGGIGTLMMVAQIFPLLKVFGADANLQAINTNKNYPFNFKRIGRQIILIYSALTVFEILLLFIGGIDIFKSTCYGFGTISSGCFSPENQDIAKHSPFVQYLFVIFMGLSGVGFYTFLLVVSGRGLKKLLIKTKELKLYAFVMLAGSLFIGLILYLKCGFSAENSFRYALFQTVSFFSSSGFSATDHLIWPRYLIFAFMIFAIIGGCSGSTSGGIKISRLSMILQNFRCSFSKLFNFSEQQQPECNDGAIDEKTNLSVLSFVSLFGMLLLTGIILLTLSGVAPIKSAFLITTSMATIGHNLSVAEYSTLSKLIMSLFMLIGRLEIYPVLVLLVPSFYGTKFN